MTDSLSPLAEAAAAWPDTAEPALTPSGQLLDLTIEAMAFGGKGIARTADGGPEAAGRGKVWFVEGAVPGDRVRVRVVRDQGRYGETETVSLLAPSPLRQPPPCPHARACGGCQWQGIDYEQQLQWKAGFVTAALRRIGKLGDDVPLRILPSPALYGYRNRVLVRLHWDPASGKTPRVGYFARASRTLVPIASCAIAAPALNGVIAQLTRLELGDVAACKARLELQEIRGLEGPAVVVTIHPADGPRAAQLALLERVRALAGIAWAGLVGDLHAAPILPYDEDLGLVFFTMPGQFQQVNVPHNHTLRRLAHGYVERLAPRRILDLCCGSGNLSLPLADGERDVEAIESNRKAIFCAHRNVEANGVRRLRLLTGDAEKHLWKCDRAGEKFDLVILDPPRQGMFKGMVPLRNIAPEHIVYVSCDPNTLARDLSYLCRKDFYRVSEVTALDFFPNTYHVETVVLLTRAEGEGG